MAVKPPVRYRSDAQKAHRFWRRRNGVLAVALVVVLGLGGFVGLVYLTAQPTAQPEFLGDTWDWNGSDWHQAHPSRSPEPRAEPAMAYDPGSGRVLLFGGIGAHAFNDTWTWNGMDWAQEHPSVSPPTGDGFLHTFEAAVSDEADQAVLLVTSDGDTWRWKRGDWVRASSQPAIGRPIAIGFDRLSGHVIGRFGKFSSQTGTCNSETRIWTGSSFALVPTASLTSPACDGGFAFTDSQSGHMVMMSGSCCHHHLYTWSGVAWTDEGIVDSPKSSYSSVVDGTSSARAAMAALATPRQVVAFGVTSCQSRLPKEGPDWTADTLTWDAGGAGAWTVARPVHNPPFRARTAMGLDLPRGRVVLFGGATTYSCFSGLPF